MQCSAVQAGRSGRQAGRQTDRNNQRRKGGGSHGWEDTYPAHGLGKVKAFAPMLARTCTTSNGRYSGSLNVHVHACLDGAIARLAFGPTGYRGRPAIGQGSVGYRSGLAVGRWPI